MTSTINWRFAISIKNIALVYGLDHDLSPSTFALNKTTLFLSWVFFIFDFKKHLILIRTERESSWYLPSNALKAGIISGKQIEILYRATKDAIIKLMEGSQIWFR